MGWRLGNKGELIKIALLIIGRSQIQVNIIMTWIFETCTDEYGSCVRQYIVFSISIAIFGLASYSCISIFKSEHRMTYELLPLIINTVTSLCLLFLYAQIITLLVIEIYSYFLLSYGFVAMVIRYEAELQKKLKIMWAVFITVSSICLAAVIIFTVLSLLQIIRCDDDQGAGSIIILALEIPLVVIIYRYFKKSRNLINQSMKNKKQVMITEHLMNDEDQIIKVKVLQLKLVKFAFIFTIVLHIIELCCYYIADQQIICSTESNRIRVTNSMELYILTVENISELFPHFIIPFIFWYVPSKIFKSNLTIFIGDNQTQYQSKYLSSNPTLQKKEQSLYDDLKNQTNIRQRLNHTPQQRHVNRILTL